MKNKQELINEVDTFLKDLDTILLHCDSERDGLQDVLALGFDDAGRVSQRFCPEING